MRSAAMAPSVAPDIKEAWHGRLGRWFMFSALADNLAQTDALAADSWQDLVPGMIGNMFGAVALL